MRILFCGVAAIALSGCSWLGFSNNGYNSGYTNTNTGYSSTTTASGPAYRAPSKFGLTGSIGTGVVLGGNAITGNNTPGLLNVHQVSMNQAYGKGMQAELGGTYQLNRKQALTINGFYQKAKGKSDVVFANAPGAVFAGQLSDYTAYGIDAGLRHNLAKARMPLLKSVQPYVEGRVGVARISSMEGQNITLNGVAVPTAPIRLYEGRYVPTASALVGFERPIGRHAALGFETGIRYIGRGNPDDTTVSGTIFDGLNKGSDRIEIPVRIRGSYRF